MPPKTVSTTESTVELSDSSVIKIIKVLTEMNIIEILTVIKKMKVLTVMKIMEVITQMEVPLFL